VQSIINLPVKNTDYKYIQEIANTRKCKEI